MEEFDFVLFTDDKILHKKSIELDKNFKKSQSDFTKDGFFQSSYGPTLGITIPISRDYYVDQKNDFRQRLKNKLKNIISKFL